MIFLSVLKFALKLSATLLYIGWVIGEWTLKLVFWTLKLVFWMVVFIGRLVGFLMVAVLVGMLFFLAHATGGIFQKNFKLMFEIATGTHKSEAKLTPAQKRDAMARRVRSNKKPNRVSAYNLRTIS